VKYQAEEYNYKHYILVALTVCPTSSVKVYKSLTHKQLGCLHRFLVEGFIIKIERKSVSMKPVQNHCVGMFRRYIPGRTKALPHLVPINTTLYLLTVLYHQYIAFYQVLDTL